MRCIGFVGLPTGLLLESGGPPVPPVPSRFHSMNVPADQRFCLKNGPSQTGKIYDRFNNKPLLSTAFYINRGWLHPHPGLRSPTPPWCGKDRWAGRRTRGRGWDWRYTKDHPGSGEHLGTRGPSPRSTYFRGSGEQQASRRSTGTPGSTARCPGAASSTLENPADRTPVPW